MPKVSSSGHPPRPSTDRTSELLLARARLGDSAAARRLLARHVPGLRRWAHGRLPRWARNIADTADLVHDAVLHTIGRLRTFEPRGPHPLAAYLRAAVRNRIRDEHRRLVRLRETRVPLDGLADRSPSPFDLTAMHEIDARYRAALARLDPADRELIVAHIELDYSHQQLGCMTGRTPNAARMALQRAISRLAARMRNA